MKIDMKKRCRSWMITINQQSMNDRPQLCYDMLGDYIQKTFHPIYFCFCEEDGKMEAASEQTQLHIHLYMELEDGTSGVNIKKKLGTAHLEHRMGNPSECRDYIFKTGDHAPKSVTNTRPAVEYGDWGRYENVKARGGKPKTEKKLSQTEKFALYVETYNSIEEVQKVDIYFARTYRQELTTAFEKKAKTAFYARHAKTIDLPNGKQITYIDRDVYYLYGSSRCGKNFGLAMKYGSEAIYYANSSDPHLFDNYAGQPVLALDEFRSSLTLTAMLRYLDVYDVTLPCRYSNKELLANTIVVISNWPMAEQYQKVQEENPGDYKAFRNRFVRGVWLMEYDQELDRRYICCRSSKSDYSKAVRDKLNFDDPPVYCDGKTTILIDEDEMAAVKWLILNGKKTTDKNIQIAMHEPNAWANFNPDDEKSISEMKMESPDYE